ncbi:MAG TPA: hypothetical protein VFG51_02855 [Candidatus Saccharimonadia bacterium]|nr:hypothetical protein [Candidatus Saccharimonadia bacterium]
MSDKLSSALEAHETAIIAGLGKMAEHWKDILNRLRAVKAQELWRGKYKTYTEFLDKLGESSGVSTRRIYELLRANEVKAKLLRSPQKISPNLRKNVEKMTTQAFLEAGKTPEEERLKVLEEASKQTSGGPPTAPAIAAAAKAQEHKQVPGKERPQTPLDSTGTKIPAPALPFWERRNEVQSFLNQISEIKCAIEKAKVAGDSLYSWIGTPAIDALENAYTTISNAKLYAVCTKCEGWWDRMTGGGCSTCHNTGLLSKHQFDVCSDPRVKKIREASNSARA